MKIILEGVDGAGKTTLAKILANEYGLDVCHCTQHDPADYEFYKNTARKENVVWDRHTIGELVYPEIFNRKPKISPEDARLILYYARQEGAKVFVLTSDLVTLKKRLSTRGGEDQRILDNLWKIDSEFRFYAENFHIPIINTQIMTLGEIFDLIEGGEN